MYVWIGSKDVFFFFFLQTLAVISLVIVLFFKKRAVFNKRREDISAKYLTYIATKALFKNLSFYFHKLLGFKSLFFRKEEE